MVHFDFKVSPIDAENIFSCMTQEIFKCQESMLDCVPEERVWYIKRIEYIKELIIKMKHT